MYYLPDDVLSEYFEVKKDPGRDNPTKMFVIKVFCTIHTKKLSYLFAVLDPQELDREAVSEYNFIVLAANECGSEGELPPLDTFDDRAKLNVTVTVGDVDDEDPVH